MAVYLDYNATTPIDPEAAQVVAACLQSNFGNPSSRDHRFGWDAAEALEDARDDIADCVGATPRGLVFTSGATESLNTALRGFVGFDGWAGKKILVGASEHSAVLETCHWLSRRTGVEVELLAVDAQGRLDLQRLRDTLRAEGGAKSVLVALMAANNETGVLHPVKQIAAIVHDAGAILLCDLTQAVGKVEVDLTSAGIDLAAFCAHKVYGPKGVGALWISPRLEEKDMRWQFEPLLLGGQQESSRRGGTVNVAGALGFARACRNTIDVLPVDRPRIQALRNHFEAVVLEAIPGAQVNCLHSPRLPNTTSLCIRGVSARALVRDMPDVALSTGSACASARREPSHVLRAIGLSELEADACLRVSLGRPTVIGDIECALARIAASVRRFRVAA